MGTSVESRIDREPMDSPFEVGAIYKRLKKTGILILDDAFSANGENSTNCLARPTRDWLLTAARGRNARRTGNFREGERQHVVLGMRGEL
jgi:hypothetical protein